MSLATMATRVEWVTKNKPGMEYARPTWMGSESADTARGELGRRRNQLNMMMGWASWEGGRYS